MAKEPKITDPVVIESANALAKMGVTLPANKFDDDTFDAVATSTAFLPRIQLMISSSGKCKASEFPINHIALIEGSEYIDLGEEVPALMVSWRPKALEIGENIITSYDIHSEQFKRIAEKSEVKGSQCMFGIEFLVWLPINKVFASAFFGSVSARIEAKKVKGLIGETIFFGAKKITGRKFTWFTLTAIKNSAPIELPAVEVLTAAVELFTNPKDSEIESVDEPESKERER